MRTLRLVTALALGTLPAAHALAQRPARARVGLRAELVGCYALFTAPAGGAERSLYNASASVRIDSQFVGYLKTDKDPNLARVLVALTPPNAPTVARPRPFAPSWTADSLTDTVRLSFVDGFSGAVFVLAARPGQADTLTGRRFESWDFGPPFETTHGPARAIRRPCSGSR